MVFMEPLSAHLKIVIVDLRLAILVHLVQLIKGVWFQYLLTHLHILEGFAKFSGKNCQKKTHMFDLF